MKYYITDSGLLIRENPETKIIKVFNRTNKINVDNYIITPEDFINTNKKQIKSSKWNELMNIWFRDVKHEWKHEHSYYRKLDNFEQDGNYFSKNYILGKDIPFHTNPSKTYWGNFILVYHQGKVYYHTISYNGYPQGQLLDINTFQSVKWTRLKNCAPIFNENTKKIC